VEMAIVEMTIVKVAVMKVTVMKVAAMKVCGMNGAAMKLCAMNRSAMNVCGVNGSTVSVSTAMAVATVSPYQYGSGGIASAQQVCCAGFFALFQIELRRVVACAAWRRSRP
jgi:hypothetical protein